MNESTIELSQLPCLTKTLKYLRNRKNKEFAKKLTVDEIQDITRVANAYLIEFINSNPFINPKMKVDIENALSSCEYSEHFNS